MTHGPNRDPGDRREINVIERPIRRANDSLNIGVTVAVLAILVLGGLFWYGTNNTTTVGTNDRPIAQGPATTGVGTGAAEPRNRGNGAPPAAKKPAPRE